MAEASSIRNEREKSLALLDLIYIYPVMIACSTLWDFLQWEREINRQKDQENKGLIMLTERHRPQLVTFVCCNFEKS